MSTARAGRSLGAFEPSLAQLRDWRQSTAEALAQLRRWALVNQLTDEHTAMRLAHLERRLSSERLAIAFVAEVSRGKSELINALFFADLGARLLPAGAGLTTMCPAEIFHDATRPPSIRVLAIESREESRALREHIADSATWREIPLDPAAPRRWQKPSTSCRRRRSSRRARPTHWDCPSARPRASRSRGGATRS